MIHDGHRERIRKKFMNGDSLEDHEILEILLFSSIPRANTNEIAHHLIKRFGSFRGVFDANATSLQEVDGVGPSSAVLIRLVSECIYRYSLQRQDTRDLLNNREVLQEYLRALFIGCDYEKAMVLLFNASGRLLETCELGDGDVNLVHLSPRQILTAAARVNASAAVLVHNHPDGVLYPSDEDLASTLQISQALSAIHVTLIDHFIVAGDQCRPILYHREEASSAEQAPSLSLHNSRKKFT
ncbi:MAG: hypothetical protein IKA76_05595 [Clostridia bacterium]|nr:hypothetical protein [Clostridia bacterium]